MIYELRTKKNLKSLISNLKSKKGFTLIELLILIAIMGLISSLSVSFYSRFYTQNSVQNTLDQYVGELRKAQIYSMMGRQNGNWGVNFTSNRIVLYQGNSYATRTTAFDEIFNINTNISVSGIGDINYARYTGIPTNGGSTIVSTLTATIQGTSNNSKTFTINTQGVVSK